VSDWNTAKETARGILVRHAKRRAAQTITYGDLVAQLPISLEANDPRLSVMLDEISKEEYKAGRGFLTVLVVHKSGDLMPGQGFFKMATECGAVFIDRERFWCDAFKKVITYWQNN